MRKSKVLLSWLATSGDFVRQWNAPTIVNEQGPNPSFHTCFVQETYEKHVILHTEGDDKEQQRIMLQGWMAKHGRMSVEFKCSKVKDDEVLETTRIILHLEKILMDLREYEIHLNATSGTKAMHTAWYMLHLDDRFDTKLLHIREAKYTGTENPELLDIDFTASAIPKNLVAFQKKIVNRELADGPFIPKRLENTYALAKLSAATDGVGILILGESGVGKGVLAKYIKSCSIRNDKPFETVNCSALDDNLLLAELFGFKKGAYTGADQNHVGLFKKCEGGTIFLDEIGDTTDKMQKALLRVIQEKKIRPLNGEEADVNVRIIAATNKDLKEECRAGRFRWDLYYRLSVVVLYVNPLREWGKEDIGAMLERTLKKAQKDLEKSNCLQMDRNLNQFLLNYPYPGNVRELENLVYWLYVVAEEGRACFRHLRADTVENEALSPLRLECVELKHISKVMRLKNGVKAQAALALGISEGTLRNKLYKMGKKGVCE